jgi:hypothetical protein
VVAIESATEGSGDEEAVEEDALKV